MHAAPGGLWPFLNANAGSIQAVAAVVSGLATIVLIFITAKYVRLTGNLASAAATQITFHKEAEVARLNELGTCLKLASMILASLPIEQAGADLRMKQSLSWDGLDFRRFQELAAGLGPVEGKHAAIAVGAMTYLRDRAQEVKAAVPIQGYNWVQFEWPPYLEKLEQAKGRAQDILVALNARLQPPA
jgi:hypothetical protein